MTKIIQNDAQNRAKTRNLLPLVALGGGLAATPASGLELGDLSVHSSLGQPLRASIAYALAPNEMLSSTCVSVSAGQSTGGLPGIGKSTVNITERAIVITGQTAVREPMLGTRVTINCPYTPNLSREYMLFVDPAPVANALRNTPPVARPEAEPVQTPVATRQPARRAPVNRTPIGQSSNYQVQPGDTLSEIVRRIENRSMKLWPAVNIIFAANPDAFIDNDPNKLKAGAWLTIPSLDGTAPVVSATAEPAAAATAASPTPDKAPATVYDTALASEPADGAANAEQTLSAPAEATPTSVVTAMPQDADTATDSTADLKPGDVVYNYKPTETGETVVIPDTELEGPQTDATSPNVPTAVISTGTRSESTSLLAWLLGGALVVIGALALFGRRFRKGSGSTPIAAAATTTAAAADDSVEAFADYDIEDDSPTDENLALDADLVLGTGLDEGVEMDVAEADFGFAATTDLDIELPFEPEATVSADIDFIEPARMDVESILESEVLPEDDDYDMSVIVDATKMPQPEEVTERDLRAVEVGTGKSPVVDEYSVDREVDYDVLEQDYEDELTATQALNKEIARAAAELDATAELPARDDVEKTAELRSRDDIEKTDEFEASYDPNDTSAVTVNMSHDDKTAEMPVANDDETVEMEVEGGSVDTKRLG